MNKSAYLLYRPEMDYEESMEPYLICLSERKAKKIQKEAIDYYKNLYESIPPEPEKEEWREDYCEDQYTTLHNNWYHSKDAMIREGIDKAPYGIQVNYFDLNNYSFDKSVISIMKLDLY